MATDGHSKACCELPAIVTGEYTTKGRYETIGGVKTYVTGPADAKSAILYIFDIFGFRSQTLQGADILAATGNYLVFMPDFFDGNPCSLDWHPAVTEEQKAALNAWFPTRMPSTGVERIPTILKDLKSFSPSVEKWAAIGTCWGGKVVSITSGPNSPWSASAMLHPAFVDAADAAKITVPVILLASMHEPADDVKAFDEALTVDKHVETFADQGHGWMTARADFENEKSKAEYERGYKAVLDFFKKYL